MNNNQKLTAELFEEYYEIYEMLYHCAKVADSGAYALNNAFGYFSESQVLDLFNKSKQDLKNIIVANTNICTHLNTLSKKLEKIEKTNSEFELKHSSKIANFADAQRHFVAILKKQDELLSKMKTPIQTFNSDVDYENIKNCSFENAKSFLIYLDEINQYSMKTGNADLNLVKELEKCILENSSPFIRKFRKYFEAKFLEKCSMKKDFSSTLKDAESFFGHFAQGGEKAQEVMHVLSKDINDETYNYFFENLDLFIELLYLAAHGKYTDKNGQHKRISTSQVKTIANVLDQTQYLFSLKQKNHSNDLMKKMFEVEIEGPNPLGK